MKLMRDDMRALSEQIKESHAGLLIQKGLKIWESDDTKKKLHSDGKLTDKEKLINTIASVTANELYKLAFERWLVSTYNLDNIEPETQSNPNFAHISANIVGRLYTGLVLGDALETGVMTHHTYGMPMIAGSSVKGAVRNYTELLFAKRDSNDHPILKKDDKNIERIEIDPKRQPIIDVLFGKGDDDNPNKDDNSNNDAGYIIWYDAWWIPPVEASEKDSKPFVGEIVTVHHQKYYKGDLEQALDMESPVPNQQLAVQGCFYFAIEGDGESEEGKKLLKLAKDLLIATIEQQGLGAKSSSGYGYFELDSSQIDDMMKIIIKNKEEADKKKQLEKEMENASPLMQELLTAISDKHWYTGQEKHRESFSQAIDIWLDKLEAPNTDILVIKKFIEIHKLFFANHWKKKPSNKNAQKRIRRLKKLKEKLT